MKLRIGLLLLFVVALTSRAGAQVNWFQTATPSPRCCMGMTDAVTTSPSGVIEKYTLMFGGVQGFYSTLGDTWKLEDGGWFQLSPANSPSAREGPGMAFDAATRTVVLFGGSTGLFGGGCCDLNDTWIWDGTNWTQAFPPVSPPARRFDGGGMAYDPSTGTIVLFGGAIQGNTYLGDTWVWNGTTRTWTQQSPSASPSPRVGHGMTNNGNVLLFGGNNGSTNLADTWVWNGTTWRQRSPATSPPARTLHMLAHDAALGKVVLFGGQGFNDTWTWDGTTWTQIFPATAPPDRYAFGMVYDADARAVVIFGGFSFCCGIHRDTWKLSLGP